MATTEETRRQLFETVRDHLGEPAAEQLMAVTIPANTDLATRQDLDLLRAELHVDMAELRSELRGEMAELRGDMGELRGDMAELRGDMAGLRGDMAGLRGDMAGLRGEMRTAVADLRTELHRRVLPMIGAIVTAVVGIGLTILGLLQR